MSRGPVEIGSVEVLSSPDYFAPLLRARTTEGEAVLSKTVPLEKVQEALEADPDLTTTVVMAEQTSFNVTLLELAKTLIQSG